jgi:NADH-quinone oxidoreductase subunit G
VIHLTVDGKDVTVPEGTLILDAARSLGIDVPTFCYHHRMKPVAACRMCLVEVDKRPKLEPACAVSVAEGMVVHTRSERVKTARAGVLEFLLIQHPLDCPVCDKGGECDLQDNAFGFGASRSRYADPKHPKDKARPLSDLVVLDEERCILCLRCVRFMSEVAEQPELALRQRGAVSVVDTFPGRPFTSPFSGNTIEMCPVGALTSRPYRFRARPWDNHSADAICGHCPVGCNLTAQARDGEMVRVLSRENLEVDGGWLCDRGRFGYRYVHHEDRYTEPVLNLADGPRVLSWPEALDRVRRAVRAAGSRSALLGGGRLTAEAQVALADLMRGVGSPWVDHLTGYLRQPVAPGPRARIADLDGADRILLVGVDPRRAVPVLDLRLLQAVRGGARLSVVADRHLLGERAHARRVHLPGQAEAAVAALAAEVRRGVTEGVAGELSTGSRVVVVWDGESAPGAMADLVEALGDRLVGTLVAGGEAGSQGAERAGLYAGHDCREILEAAAAGRIDLLIVADPDLVDHAPDPALARRALDAVPAVIALAALPSEATRRAQMVLPLATPFEMDGHLVNLEGRVQSFTALLPPPGQARPDWRVAADLAGIAADREALLAAYERRPEPAPRALSDRPATVGEPAEGEFRLSSVPLLFGPDVTFEPGLRSRAPEPTVWLHPDQLAALGVAPGDAVRLAGAGTEVTVTAQADPELPAGQALVPRGIADLPADRLSRVPVRLTALQPLAKEA